MHVFVGAPVLLGMILWALIVSRGFRLFAGSFAAVGTLYPMAAGASPVTLACFGEVARFEAGKQVNPIGEKYSVVVKIDTASKSLVVGDSSFAITDPDRETIVSMGDHGSVSLNRITGWLTFHSIEAAGGLKTFDGACQRAAPLF